MKEKRRFRNTPPINRYPIPDNDMERLFSKLSEPTDKGCRLYTGYTDKDGYGRIMLSGYRYMVHVAAAMYAYGPIPHNHQVCHTCDNPPCAEFTHLFYGTVLDNHLDAVGKGRKCYGETAVPRKLTMAMANEIRGATGSQLVIAQKYGISQSMVSKVKRGESWGVEVVEDISIAGSKR